MFGEACPTAHQLRTVEVSFGCQWDIHAAAAHKALNSASSDADDTSSLMRLTLHLGLFRRLTCRKLRCPLLSFGVEAFV